MPLLEKTPILTGHIHPHSIISVFCTNYEPHLALWAFQSMTLAYGILDIRDWLLC